MSDLSIPGMFSPTELALPPGLPFEDWMRVGETLRDMERGVQFWLGDWLVYGEQNYPEDMYLQAIEETPYTHGTLRNMAYVARTIPAPLRNENLTYSHHAAVAALEPETRSEWLARAVDDKMSVGELRGRLKANVAPQVEFLTVPAERLREAEDLAALTPGWPEYKRRWRP